jgi:aspartate/methionine/tyrosine aminotransferase
MKIETFKMERMQSTYENLVDCNLSESGVEPMRPLDLLDTTDDWEEFRRQSLGYSQSNGTELLRDRIAAFYPGAARDNVIVTNGGSEANYATFWSTLERGDRVAYMLPNYLQTWGLARAYAGGAQAFRLVPKPDGRRGQRWGLDVEGFERAVGKKCKLILITNPNNPTAGVLSADEMDVVVRAAKRAGAWLVVDEIYRGAEMDGDTTPTFYGRYDKVVITSGLSKAFGLPGLRIGWVVAPPAFVEKIWSYHDYTSIAPGALSDFLARRALEPKKREQIFARTRTLMQRNWPVLRDWIAERQEFLSVIPPVAGAIALIRYDLPIASVPMIDRLRVEKSTLIVAGDQLGIPKHIRIGFGYGSEPTHMLEGLSRIDALMREVREWSGGKRGRRSVSKSRRPSPRAASARAVAAARRAP